MAKYQYLSTKSYLHCVVLWFYLVGVGTESSAEEEFKLLLLHNNDMHSRFEETSWNSATCKKLGDNCIGGFARTAHVIRMHRKQAEEGNGPPVLFVNAGDTYAGSSWFSVFKWKICVDFINMLHPDVLSFGNHEFDNGIEGLVPFIDNLEAPIVAANLDFRNEPTVKNVKKSVVLTVAGHQIGFIGHLTQETARIASPGATIFLNEVESVRNESERLNKEGVKIIIALGHSGYNVDKEIAQLPLIDVVVGGHTNTFLWNGPQPSLEPVEDPYPKVIVQKTGKKVPVVQAYAYTKYLGRLNLTFNAEGDLISFDGQPLLLEPTIPQDQDVLDLLDNYRPQITALHNKVVGKTSVLLDGNPAVCRFKECNFGNLIADAMVSYVASSYKGPFWTRAPIGLMNGGGIRISINPDSNQTITRGDILGALPFGSEIITLNLTGSQIVETLELGIRSNGETSHGEFLQVSGLKVVYDQTQPAMKRVVNVKVRCGNCQVPKYEDLKPDANYRVVTHTFLSDGGDGHYVLKNAKNKIHEDILDVDMMEWYLTNHNPALPEIQGRITFTSDLIKNAANILRFNWITATVTALIVAATL